MYRRLFLNHPKHHSIGLVLARVERKTIEFVIGDCGKQITLDFEAGDKAEQQNSLYKINTLLDVVSEFRDALVEEFAKRNQK